MWADFIKQRGINLDTSTYWNVSYFLKITVLWFLSLISHNLTMSFEQSADRLFFLCKFVACWNAQRFHTVCTACEETCSWRDCTPEILGAAGWEPYFGCVLPHGVLVYLPTLLWVFSAQLAVSLLSITTLLAVTTQSPAEIQCDDPDSSLLWKDIEVLKTGMYYSPCPHPFFPLRIHGYSLLLKKLEI